VTARSISITRRLVLTVLLLELLSSVTLVVAVTVHEHHIQLKAFDATLAGTTESLMGAVQDAEDEGDNVLLDLRGLHLDKHAVYRVADEHGRILGTAGNITQLPGLLTASPGFHDTKLDRRSYRFFVLHGIRTIDPGKPDGGVSHAITIVYGTPAGRVWHEVIEAVQFFTIATILLLALTGIAMVVLVKKYLSPIYELAHEADQISFTNWQFNAPTSARQVEELLPLTNALESAVARVQLSFEQQKRFTRDAAHELKTDIAIVKSSLQLLSMRKRTTDEYAQGLSISLDDFTRLESTVQKLLTLARLEQPTASNQTAIASSSCSLRDAVEEAIQQSASLAELKTVEVLLDSSENPTIPIDGRDATLLCSNILVNALQHSHERGQVQIALTHIEKAVVLTVKDWGDGIAPEDRPFLFDAFYRGDISRSRKSGGTGLGLAICKAICNNAGGTIEISNHDAGGAVVTVTLPTSNEELVVKKHSA
jgi:two-component system OmpR family sensor kinase